MRWGLDAGTASGHHGAGFPDARFFDDFSTDFFAGLAASFGGAFAPDFAPRFEIGAGPAFSERGDEGAGDFADRRDAPSEWSLMEGDEAPRD